ncbi:MAG TPA: ABC transporter substrate-binding protein [Bacillota bacterium]|nr:ABC transporter substrate-binding protein [Bacillota bacterium]
MHIKKKKGVEKMKKVSKVTALTLAAIMLFSACSAGVKEGAEVQSPAKKVTIEYWHGQPDTMGGAQIGEFVKGFNAQSDTTEVVVKYFNDQYTGILQGLQADAAAGTAPGIIQLGWLYADYFMKNFKYTPPQKIIDDYFPDDATFLTDAFDENILDLCEFNGVRIGAPYSLSSSVMFYNVDLLKQAGLPEKGPQTWEDVAAYSRQIKEKTGKYGVYVEEYNWTYYTLMSSNGSKVTTSKDGKSYANFATGNEGAEAYQFMSDLIKKGYALHTTVAEGMQSFKDGNVGMAFATIAQMNSIEKSANFKVASISAPSFGDKKPVLHAGGCMLAITALSEEQKKASWEFMKFLLSRENISEWTKATGYVPARNDVSNAEDGLKGYLEKNPLMWAAMDQIPNMVAWPFYSGDAGLAGDVYMMDVRDKILNGSNAKEVLTEAQDYINKMVN